MALSWSMDKIGPITRSVEDAAIVFNVIRGLDYKDMTLYDLPYYFNPNIELSTLKIGYFKGTFDQEGANQKNYAMILSVLKNLGATLVEVDPPKFNSSSLSFILDAEAAAAFDELTLSNQDDLLKRQIKNAWPNVFRKARHITAVEYIQANRARSILMKEMNELMSSVDVIITPAFAKNMSLSTNLTGHPCIFVPIGLNDNNRVTGITVFGDLFDEGMITSVAHQIQKQTKFYKTHPKGF